MSTTEDSLEEYEAKKKIRQALVKDLIRKGGQILYEKIAANLKCGEREESIRKILLEEWKERKDAIQLVNALLQTPGAYGVSKKRFIAKLMEFISFFDLQPVDIFLFNKAFEQPSGADQKDLLELPRRLLETKHKKILQLSEEYFGGKFEVNHLTPLYAVKDSNDVTNLVYYWEENYGYLPDQIREQFYELYQSKNSV